MSNQNFVTSRIKKNDEFYTRYEDVENELQHYDFHDKIVYCNCDTAESNFVKYFQNNPVKQLIYTSDDFRTHEDILTSCDVVVTNPPFSLFKEYLSFLMKHDKQFLIIGNKNIIGGKQIFPHIKENKIWLGYTSPQYFIQPDNSLTKKLNGLCRWFTNIPIQKRYSLLPLTKKYTPTEYPRYDNFDAINVNKIKDIPMDYDGVMGVPITFLDSYNPQQFKILGTSTRGNLWGLRTKVYDKSECADANDLNANAVIKTPEGYKSVYVRVMIQRT